MDGQESNRRRKKIAIILLIGIVLILGLYLLSVLKPKTPVEEKALPAPLREFIEDEEKRVLIKEDSFEYEKTFDFPKEEWWKKESFEQMDWYLEGPTKYTDTSTDYSFSGVRSTKLKSEPQKRAVLAAADFEHWNVSKKAMSFYFFLSEDQYKTKDAGIWINIDLVDHEKRVWKNAIVGINRFGDIYYGAGYGPNQEERPYSNFNGGFTLDYSKWYKLELYADFDNFGPDKKGMILKLYTEEKTYEWALPLNSWSDQDWEMFEEKGYKLYEFSFGAYYFGISRTGYEKCAYFDDVKCYIWANEHK